MQNMSRMKILLNLAVLLSLVTLLSLAFIILKTLESTQKQEKHRIYTKQRPDAHILLDNLQSDAKGYLKFKSYMRTKDYPCEVISRVGNDNFGGWWVCQDPPFTLRPNKPCLVYSFGIENDWSFDDHVSLVYGCEVHSFDPSINQTDHKRSDLIYFHNLGILPGNPTANWKMASFNDIVKMLRHEQRIIDVVKMDVEQSEFDAIDDMARNNKLKDIKQLLLEVHNWKRPFQDGITLLKTLEDNGFRKFSFRDITHRKGYEILKLNNILKKSKATNQYEICFVNSLFADKNIK